MSNILVIDTSYGSTVGVVGHKPIVETDSRTHVERLQVNVARTMDAAGLAPRDLDRIVVGVGPAPFTGLRAGIVAAKALAFATGAQLVGCDILAPQAAWNAARRAEVAGEGTGDDTGAGTWHILTLAVNDARRKQLYFQLEECGLAADGGTERPAVLIGMDIDYPAQIVERANAAVTAFLDAHPGDEVAVDIVGHGAAKYADALAGLDHAGEVIDQSVLDQGARGLELFARCAMEAIEVWPDAPVEPLYLRRPDAEVPNPLKHVLNHGGATKVR